MRDLFWWCQIDHVVTANRGTKLAFVWTYCTSSGKDPEVALFLSSQPNSLCQTRWTFSQPHNAWRTSSELLEQRWHTSSCRMVLFFKFALVARNLYKISTQECLILSRTINFQILFQISWFMWSNHMEGNFYKLGIIWTFFGRASISHNCLENCDIYILSF